MGNIPSLIATPYIIYADQWSLNMKMHMTFIQIIALSNELQILEMKFLSSKMDNSNTLPILQSH